ncbi:hypothetical protein LguiA_026384 [Lonicera macranthoides]
MAAESFVFQTAGQILGKLTTLAFREIGSIWGVKKDFKRLESTVSAIKAVLLDAAEQKKKSRQVEDWLEKLQDVLYDIDDVLDDFMTEDLRRKVVIKGSKRKAVKSFFSSSNSLALRITMSRKLKKIRSRLEDIDADRKQFGLVERAPDSPFAYPLREQAHSFVHAPDVVGRDLDKSRIIELLLSDSSSSASSSTIENISVLPIVGLGGLGKTTLANLVYLSNQEVFSFETQITTFISQMTLNKSSKTCLNKCTIIPQNRLKGAGSRCTRQAMIDHGYAHDRSWLKVVKQPRVIARRKLESGKEQEECARRRSHHSFRGLNRSRKLRKIPPNHKSRSRSINVVNASAQEKQMKQSQLKKSIFESI